MYVVVSSVMASIITLVLVVLLYKYILPEGNRPKLNRFFTLVHDVLTINSLWLDKILRFLYVVSAVGTVVFGFFCLFNSETYLIGAGLILFGPIACRITFEILMFAVLAVENIMEINEKLKK